MNVLGDLELCQVTSETNDPAAIESHNAANYIFITIKMLCLIQNHHPFRDLPAHRSLSISN